VAVRPTNKIRTRFETERRILLMVVAIGASHFWVDSLDFFLSDGCMALTRFGAGVLIALLSVAIETYKQRQARLR